MISIFSLRKKFVEMNFKVNQAINLISKNYLLKRHHTHVGVFPIESWVECLNADSKRKMWNMAYRSRDKFSIEVESQMKFLLRLSDDKMELLYDKQGMYGSLIDFHICEIGKVITTY